MSDHLKSKTPSNSDLNMLKHTQTANSNTHTLSGGYLGDLGLVLLFAFLQGGEVMAGTVEVHHLPVTLRYTSLQESPDLNSFSWFYTEQCCAKVLSLNV